MLCKATAVKANISLSLATSEGCLDLDLADTLRCVEMSRPGVYLCSLHVLHIYVA